MKLTNKEYDELIKEVLFLRDNTEVIIKASIHNGKAITLSVTARGNIVVRSAGDKIIECTQVTQAIDKYINLINLPNTEN